LHEAEPRDGAECCLWIATQTGYVPVMVDPESIYHWHRLDDRITTSGQPSETQLADIAALGVRYVINLGLHSHEKALRDEAASVHALGMTYVHIPVDFQNPSPPMKTDLNRAGRHRPGGAEPGSADRSR
jgi:hypothetical protein